MRHSAALAAGVALGAGCLVAAVAAPAVATTVTDEMSFRAAWTNPAEMGINLGKDIKLTCARGGTAVRNSKRLLTLDGHGRKITQTCANNGVLEQDGVGPLRLRNLTITGGNATGTMGNGGGLRTRGELTVTNGKITHNKATGMSNYGPTGLGGGIFSERAVTLARSVISDNTSNSGGGGIWVDGALRVTRTTIRGNNNTGNFAGGIGASASASTTITNSTIAGNTSAGIGGGGISANGSWTITNSTITGNTASFSGGGILTATGAQLTLVYATVVDNTAPSGTNVSGFGTLISFGSVVALPHGSVNCGIAHISNGFNLSDDASCGFTGVGDAQNLAPQLGALANNGGPTQTRLPQPGSPLIDAVSLCQGDGANGVTTDQRGFRRPPQGCDIGAVESAFRMPRPPTTFGP